MKALSKWPTLFVGSLALVGLLESEAWADRVSGRLTSTYVMVENTDLIGDITCAMTNAPCFSFGAPGIELRLNGFTITGGADAVTGCGGTAMTPEAGVLTNNQSNVVVRGPGLIQRFRGDGVLVAGSTGARIEDFTVSTSCMSGVRISPTSFGTFVQGVVAVRNGHAANPCGGI